MIFVPTLDEHKNKYKQNKELLDNELNIATCSNYDWIVIVVFYSALHLVEGELAKQNLHTYKHDSRMGMVNKYSSFVNIRATYKYLYDRSIVARYHAANSSNAVAQKCLKHLSDIEKEISL